MYETQNAKRKRRDHVDRTRRQAIQTFLAVARFLNILVSQFVQRGDDDAAHRARVVHYEEAHADILCDPDGGRCIRLLIGGEEGRFKGMDQ